MLNKAYIAVLAAFLLTLPSAVADPVDDIVGIAAATGYSCTVSKERNECEFLCAADKTVSVSASASKNLGKVGISGSCGGATASCSATDPDSPCSKTSDGKTGSNDTGICSLTTTMGNSGTGSCGSQAPDIEDCIDLVITCFNPIDGDALEKLPDEVEIPEKIHQFIEAVFELIEIEPDTLCNEIAIEQTNSNGFLEELLDHLLDVSPGDKNPVPNFCEG